MSAVFCYDANGNMPQKINGSTTSYTYDAENRMTAVSGAAAATFVYDGDGRDLCTPRAQREGQPGEGRGGWRDDDLHRQLQVDTLRVKADQRLDGFGLMDYNARYYSSTLGRFISPDTIIPQPGNPMAWDRYSYVYSNPVNSVDPSGHMACEWDGNGNCVRDPDWEPGLDTLKKKKNETPIVLLRSGEDAIEQTKPEKLDDFVSILEFYVATDDFLQLMEIVSNIGKPLYKWTKGTLPGGFAVEALLGFITQFSSDFTNQNIARPIENIILRASAVGIEDGLTGELSNWVAIPLATGAGTVCNVAAAVCAGATYLLVANGVTLFMDNVIWAPINNELGIYRE